MGAGSSHVAPHGGVAFGGQAIFERVFGIEDQTPREKAGNHLVLGAAGQPSRQGMNAAIGSVGGGGEDFDLGRG
jgi:hypothetical protein